jgi:putative transposase
MVTPAAERKAVSHLMDAYGMSERRTRKAVGCCRMTTRADDAALRLRMKAVAHERRGFGYWRLRVLLKREGYVINHKKISHRAAASPDSRSTASGLDLP